MLILGVDEAGRGALAGSVYAAAVVLHPQAQTDDLMDSKVLTPKRRCWLAREIREHRALDYCVATASADEVDSCNVLQASLLAMRRAIMGISIGFDQVEVDGLHAPEVPFKVRASARADANIPQVSAASILAKTARDEYMVRLGEQYPQYEFATHKGYPSPRHLELLTQHGPCCYHRKTFAPVARVLQ